MKIGLTILLIALFAQVASPADTFRLEGSAVSTEASISWGSITNHLPETVRTYKIAPQTFSKEVTSRAMEIAGFTPLKMKTSADKKTMQWRFEDEKGTLQRGLEICPSRGWISLFNYQTEHTGSTPSTNVPTFERVDALARLYLKQLGGDTNQLSLHEAYRTDHEREVFSHRGGSLSLSDVTMRGCMYAREIDGITFVGKSRFGGLWIEFGNHEKVARLNLSWRNLQADKTYKMASLRQMTKFIKDGLATIPEQDFDPLKLTSAKSILINSVILHYSGEPGDTDQAVAFPFAELRANVTLDDSSRADCILYCPVITETAIEQK